MRGGEDCPRQFCNNPATKVGAGKVSWGVSVKNRAYFLMLAATTLLSAPAMAAPVFMLQFGSFETREEADKRLVELKSQHAGVIGGMQSGIREVTLPPDNLTVYRTQAGPVETRASAQSICGQLASNGDECYVVETAMAPSFAAPTQVAQASTPTPPAVAAPAAMPVTAAPLPVPQALATTTTPPVVAAAPAPLRDPSNMSTAALITPGASTTAPQAVPPVNMSPVPMRDPSNAAAISRVTAAPATTQTTAAAPMPVAAAPMPAPTASPSMQKAMDEAAIEQTDMEAKRASAPTPRDAKPEGTFWSRLNPFSSDEPKVAAAPAPVLAKPVTVETPVVETSVAPAPKAMAPEPVMAAPQPLSPLPQEMPPMAAAPAPSTSALLPPPPAPTMGRGAIPANSTSASLRAPAPVVVPEPTGTLQSPPPIVIGDTTGNVRVGEAQRVPLSQATVPAPVMALPAPPVATAPALMPAPSPALSPSANLGVKTLWAHVGQFADAQAALAFWDQYRRSHPDFPVVRVRVTSPLQSLNHGNDKVSLRVGPFAKEASIRTLCTTIAQQQTQTQGERLICGSIVDMGIASRVGGARNGFLPGSRYQR